MQNKKSRLRTPFIILGIFSLVLMLMQMYFFAWAELQSLAVKDGVYQFTAFLFGGEGYFEKIYNNGPIIILLLFAAVLILFTLPVIRIRRVENKNSGFLHLAAGMLIAGVLILFANVVYFIISYESIFVQMQYNVGWRDVLAYKLPFFTYAIFFFAFALFFVAVARIKTSLVSMLSLVLAGWLVVSALAALAVINIGTDIILIAKSFVLVAWLFAAVLFFVNAFAKDKSFVAKKAEAKQTSPSLQTEQPFQADVLSVPPPAVDARKAESAEIIQDGQSDNQQGK